jgi:hypothetical protein
MGSRSIAPTKAGRSDRRSALYRQPGWQAIAPDGRLVRAPLGAGTPTGLSVQEANGLGLVNEVLSKDEVLALEGLALMENI